MGCDIKSKVPCIGSFNRKIEIYTSSLDGTNSRDFKNKSFTPYKTVYAFIKTPNGKIIFDDIGTSFSVTHQFYIRFIPNITSQKWIYYNGNRFNIINVINIEEMNRYLILNSNITGSITKDGSK